MENLDVGDKGLEELSKLEDGQEPSAGPDIFEKLFGKKPEVGYEFTHLSFSFGWRAVCFQWSCKGVGFGEAAFQFKGEEGFDIDHECMGYDFVIALVDEAVRRIDAGQKARKSVQLSYIKRKYYELMHTYFKKTSYPECMGYKEVDSDEGHEQFLKNVMLTFKHYIQPEEKKDEQA